MTPTPLVRDWLASIHAPKTDLVVLEDVGHLSMMAAPDAFLEALVAHVRPIARKQ
jgi:pimeloyl-ACP methyl ester carboxylesterase